MGLILSEPIKQVVEILKILKKTSVKDANIHPNPHEKFTAKIEGSKARVVC
jgi:hypothetical protein